MDDVSVVDGTRWMTYQWRMIRGGGSYKVDDVSVEDDTRWMTYQWRMIRDG